MLSPYFSPDSRSPNAIKLWLPLMPHVHHYNTKQESTGSCHKLQMIFSSHAKGNLALWREQLRLRI